MRDIRVRKAELLQRLRENRDAHRAEFLKAQENFRIRVISVLDQMLEEARSGKPIRTSLGLLSPQDHTADYNNAIEMLDMSVEPDILLDEQSFRWFVRNEWSWHERADFLNKTYASGMFVAENGRIGG